MMRTLICEMGGVRNTPSRVSDTSRIEPVEDIFRTLRDKPQEATTQSISDQSGGNVLLTTAYPVLHYCAVQVVARSKASS